MKRIGIIGVGEIGRAIVEGLCEGPGGPTEIHLSPRGAATAAALAERYDRAEVRESNQDVADRSDLVVIALRPRDKDALAGLRVGADKTVVNLFAGVGNDQLRRILATDAPMVRAIPLPTVRERSSVSIVYPSRPETDELFDLLGGAQPVADESAFDVFSTVTGTLTSYYKYVALIAAWAEDQGIDPQTADRFVRGVFQGLGRSLGDDTRSLARLAADHETPGGNNEFVRTAWLDEANAETLHRTLDALRDRLRR